MLDTSKTKFEINGVEINGVYTYSKGAGTNGEIRHRALADGIFRYLPTGHNETLLSMQVYDQSDAGISLLKLASTNSRIFDLVITYQDGAVESTKAFVRNITAQGGKRNGAAIGFLNISIRMTDITQITPPLNSFFAVSHNTGQSLYLGTPAPIASPFYEVLHPAGQTLRLGSTAPLPVNDFYTASVPAGSQLNLGAGSMLLWSPVRDSLTGEVTPASWASIPVSTKDNPRFVKVDGWDMVAGITADLLANGFDPQTMAWGNGKVGSTLKAWTGQAFDPLSKIGFYSRGGGHADASINGIWKHDFKTLRYSIVDMPTDPNDPIDQWPVEYKTINGIFTSGIDFNGVTDFSVTPMAITSYTTYMDSTGRFHEQMPSDGRPASMHYYNGIGKLGDWVWTTRNRKFSYNLVTGESKTEHWTKDGQSFIPDINNDLVYHAASDTYYGKFAAANASFDFSKLSGDDPLDIKSAGLPSGTATTSETVMVQKDADSLILFKPSTDTVGAFVAEFDMSTETWGPKRDLVNASGSTRPWYVQEMIPAIFIPDWGDHGSILFHFTWSGDADDGEPMAKDWWILDYDTLEPKRFGAITGYPSEHGEHTGNKFFVTEMAGMEFAFYMWVRDEQSELYVMRLK